MGARLLRAAGVRRAWDARAARQPLAVHPAAEVVRPALVASVQQRQRVRSAEAAAASERLASRQQRWALPRSRWRQRRALQLLPAEDQAAPPTALALAVAPSSPAWLSLPRRAVLLPAAHASACASPARRAASAPVVLRAQDPEVLASRRVALVASVTSRGVRVRLRRAAARLGALVALPAARAAQRGAARAAELRAAVALQRAAVRRRGAAHRRVVHAVAEGLERRVPRLASRRAVEEVRERRCAHQQAEVVRDQLVETVRDQLVEEALAADPLDADLRGVERLARELVEQVEVHLAAVGLHAVALRVVGEGRERRALQVAAGLAHPEAHQVGLLVDQ